MKLLRSRGAVAVAALLHAACPPLMAAVFLERVDLQWLLAGPLIAVLLCLGAGGRRWIFRAVAAVAYGVLATTQFLFAVSLWLRGDGGGFDPAFWWHFNLSSLPIAFGEFRNESAVALAYIATGVALPFIARAHLLPAAVALPAALVAAAFCPPVTNLARHLTGGPPAPPGSVMQALWERHTLDVPRQQPSAKRNLVLIYLESLERTYFDQELFGDLTPHLRQLAARSVEFTNVRQVPGTGMTIAGLVSSQCGFPLGGSFHANQVFASLRFDHPGACLAQLLANSGYQTVYLGGANSSFAGKGDFLRQNGYAHVLGHEALGSDLADAAYRTGWGLYDDSLFDLAFARFEQLAATGTPFVLTLLTLDTHQPNGNPSRSCAGLPRERNRMLHAVRCSDYLTTQFVGRLRASPAGANTLVVVASDHLAMRNSVWPTLSAQGDRRRLTLIFDAPWLDPRPIDNPGTHFDIGPTILDALGFAEYGDFPFGQSLLSHEAGFFAERGFADDDLAEIDTAAVWGNMPQVPAEIELDPTGRRVRVGDIWVPLSHWGRPLEKFSLIALIFGDDGRLSTIKSNSTARDLFHFAGKFAIVFAPRASSLRTLGVASAAGTQPAFALGRIGTQLKDASGTGVARLSTHEVGALIQETARSDGSGTGRPAPIASRVVAHAMGGLDGQTYLNCRECFEHGYARGLRYFEVDLLGTRDGGLAALHDGMEGRFGLPAPFSLAEFHNIRPGGQSPLDAQALAELLRSHGDWYLVTDIKSDQRRGIRALCAAVEAAGVSCRRRVIPQLYRFGEVDVLDEPGFDRAILTLYRMPRVDETAIAAFLAEHPQIVAVTMREDRYSDAMKLVLQSVGVQVFFHTINDASAAQSLFARGASGVYSDVLSDADLPVPTRHDAASVAGKSGSGN